MNEYGAVVMGGLVNLGGWRTWMLHWYGDELALMMSGESSYVMRLHDAPTNS